MLPQIKLGRSERAVTVESKSLAEQPKVISNQNGSFFPRGENFRLTERSKRSSLKSCGPIRGKVWIFD